MCGGGGEVPTREDPAQVRHGMEAQVRQGMEATSLSCSDARPTLLDGPFTTLLDHVSRAGAGSESSPRLVAVLVALGSVYSRSGRITYAEGLYR